jgi:hypothetical protein
MGQSMNRKTDHCHDAQRPSELENQSTEPALNNFLLDHTDANTDELEPSAPERDLRESPSHHEDPR